MLHILAIAAHPDDIELGCSGTLIKHAQQGDVVSILDLTEGELGTRGSVATRREEAAAAAKVIGAQSRLNAGMSDGFFKNDEAHQLRLISYIRYFRPDIVIANALADRHPDHGRGGRLIADACFLAGLAKIETHFEGKAQEAWRPKRVLHMVQDRIAEPTFIVDISEVYDKKLESIKCYRTQFFTESATDGPTTYISTKGFLDNVIARDSIMGKRIGVPFGEPFVCENPPGIDSLSALLLPALS
jgi:N-acetylglucosamine malate deacetylase 1